MYINKYKNLLNFFQKKIATRFLESWLLMKIDPNPMICSTKRMVMMENNNPYNLDLHKLHLFLDVITTVCVSA